MPMIQETLKVDINSIPDVLKRHPNWILWKSEKVIDEKTQEPDIDRETGEIKYTKVPYSINGYKASSTDRNSWTSFENVMEVIEHGHYDGLGFVFSEDDPFTGIDLDEVYINGTLSDEAKSTITGLNSYTERSPSGEGVHIIVKGELPGKGKRTGDYEIYDKKRFFTVTGDHLENTPLTIEERQQELNSLYERLFPEKENKAPFFDDEQTSPAMSDDEIVNLAMKFNGDRFKSLYDGDLSGHGNDHSTADLALCNILAFYTQDVDQINRMFKSSGLMRDKWDREDYSTNTITKAIQDTKNRYKVFENENPEDVFSKVSIPKDGHDQQHEFKIPSQFKAVGDTLFQTVKRGKEFHEEMVIRALPFVEAEIVNVENSQTMYRIGWSTLSNGRRITKEVVPASSISTRRELLQLSDKGFPVNDNNAKSIISYFDQFLAVNEIERVNAVERLGHVGGKFISPLHESDTEIIALDHGEVQALKAFETAGTCNEWIENLFNPIKSNPIAVFIIASSFASVILRDLRLPPFIVDLSGTTSIGKSTISKIAGSVWGRIEEGDNGYVPTWNLTRVALERKAAFLNSFPLILDDTRNANKYVLNDVVYHFSGGRGKGRGSIKGSQKEMTWNNILISNGEVPLNEYAKDKGGVSARNISFNERPIDNANYLVYNSIYPSMEKFHGTIGKEFIVVWKNNKKKLIDEFATCRNYFNEKAGSNEVLTRLSNSFAVVYFTCKILKDYLSMDIDLTAVEKLMDTLKENENLDKPLQMLDDILELIDGSQDVYGKEELKYFYKNDTDQLYLYPSFIKDILGVESNQIRKEWLNRGIAIPYEKDGRGTHPVWHANKTRKAVAINMEYVRKLEFDFRENIGDEFLE